MVYFELTYLHFKCIEIYEYHLSRPTITVEIKLLLENWHPYLNCWNRIRYTNVCWNSEKNVVSPSKLVAALRLQCIWDIESDGSQLSIKLWNDLIYLQIIEVSLSRMVLLVCRWSRCGEPFPSSSNYHRHLELLTCSKYSSVTSN